MSEKLVKATERESGSAVTLRYIAPPVAAEQDVNCPSVMVRESKDPKVPDNPAPFPE